MSLVVGPGGGHFNYFHILLSIFKYRNTSHFMSLYVLYFPQITKKVAKNGNKPGFSDVTALGSSAFVGGL